MKNWTATLEIILTIENNIISYDMGHCNLEMSDKCYGCGYYGTGDIDGCKLTIKFHKKYPNHTDEEYENYIKRRKVK